MADTGVAPAVVRGVVRDEDLVAGYVDHVTEVTRADGISGMRVAADGGNGMAGAVLPQVFARLDAELLPLYLEPDGTFPTHPADPLRPENLVDLTRLVLDEQPDIGVAFDGDADRAFFIDDQLKPLPGSTVTAMVAAWYLGREPGASIVHNLICSRAVPEIVEAHGGTPVRTRVGHSFIKGVMKETGAVFGGEHSGHYYFRENYRADSGILAMLVLLQLLSEDGRPLSEFRTEYEPYAQSGEINFTVHDQNESAAAVAAAFDGEVDELDGLTVSWDDRWFNLRPSNTEPVLRLNVEAPGPEEVDELVAAVQGVLEVGGGVRT
mgnify:CR=1 FL=1